MTITLYKKTHRQTGLKYLGKTVRDPYEYQGSGKWWTNHINKHGYDVETEILFESTDPEEIKKWGEYYSKLWNVVESKEWANLKVEQGDGGWDHMKRKITSEEYARRGRIGRVAQDEYFIKNYGSIAKGRLATSAKGKAKRIETFKKNYHSSPERQEQLRKQLKLARELTLTPESRQKKAETYQKNGHSQGERNSQFGTCWVYNEHGNKKIKKTELDTYLQQGYTRGRKL
jgi:hypothetical protein